MSSQWAVGVVTVPQRRFTHLPFTLSSLENTGWSLPSIVVFVDHVEHIPGISYSGLSVQVRRRQWHHGGYRNWLLGLAELYAMHPDADRYAMFEDDMVTGLGLREYLDSTPWPGGGTGSRAYCNLYTCPANETFLEEMVLLKVQGSELPRINGTLHRGWYPSNQRGKGAVALVFDRQGVIDLLSSPHMWTTLGTEKGRRSIDGAICTALVGTTSPKYRSGAAYREYVHSPSLVQHVGLQSTSGDNVYLPSRTFLGEQCDYSKWLAHGVSSTTVSELVIEAGKKIAEVTNSAS